ncbi:hypothetical protein CDV55_103215 [Aspergillus turcosus]|uniref:Major facilitator superfamily (MFS) profile domain-containing protein n=1 Tax=Aspergillus turcosus TaxID=1245748 RepID=A0A229YTY3_9EURO|nr:hypothetical protein CDV55_103215 [Aspergillus turcosus]RLL94797.1 hypothetical protein CFD26_104324 [Aspergillus turcosus]
MSTKPSFLRLRGQKLIYAVTLTCSFGFLLFGYDLGFMGGLSTSNEFLDVFGHPNSALLGFLVSAYEVGAMFGAAFQFMLGDRLGRRHNNMWGAGVVMIGAILQASSFTRAQFIVGRLVGGFGLGTMTTVIPVWLAECSFPRSRGRMMAMQLSNLIVGLILANWLDYGMEQYPSTVSWRFPCAFQIIFCLITMAAMPFLPESPRYLITKGRMEEAAYAMAALRDGYPDSPHVANELKEIQYAIKVEQDEAGSWSDIFKDNGVSGFQRVFVAFMANFFQQLSGVNVMSSLGPYVFERSVGLNQREALLVSGGLQVWYFLSSLLPWFLVDRCGRRTLFMVGSSGMFLCWLLSAIFEGIGGGGSGSFGRSNLGYGTAVMLYLFQTFFTIGWQSNMWIYPSEMLPLRLRLRGASLAVVSQWLWTFLVVEITPTMITNIGYKSYIVFAVINFLTVPYVYFFFPETSGMPLEAMDLLFADRDGKRPSIFRVVRESHQKKYREQVLQQLHANAGREEVNGIIEAKPGDEHVELPAEP